MINNRFSTCFSLHLPPSHHTNPPWTSQLNHSPVRSKSETDEASLNENQTRVVPLKGPPKITVGRRSAPTRSLQFQRPLTPLSPSVLQLASPYNEVAGGGSSPLRSWCYGNPEGRRR